MVLTVAVVSRINVQESWLAGSSQCFQFIPMHELALLVLVLKSQTPPMFHAYTGCNTMTCFGTKGKKTAWDTWKMYEDVTTEFLAPVFSEVPKEKMSENV